nr:MAG TPA: hypothetical protein [Caudoviricetes sp.]
MPSHLLRPSATLRRLSTVLVSFTFQLSSLSIKVLIAL